MKAKHPAAAIDTVVRSSTVGFSPEGNEDAKALAANWSGSNTVGSVVYGTEAGIFRKTLGVPTVVCGPGDIAQAHQPNEFILASQITACEDFMTRMVEWASRARTAAVAEAIRARLSPARCRLPVRLARLRRGHPVLSEAVLERKAELHVVRRYAQRFRGVSRWRASGAAGSIPFRRVPVASHVGNPAGRQAVNHDGDDLAIGAHVTRASRLEPVTPSGAIYLAWSCSRSALSLEARAGRRDDLCRSQADGEGLRRADALSSRRAGSGRMKIKSNETFKCDAGWRSSRFSRS